MHALPDHLLTDGAVIFKCLLCAKRTRNSDIRRGQKLLGAPFVGHIRDTLRIIQPLGIRQEESRFLPEPGQQAAIAAKPLGRMVQHTGHVPKLAGGSAA
ncbi:hypothetical protein D3C75_1105280 [compost metagenome]